MPVTLSDIQAKIAETEQAISKVKTAQGYGKGDKNVQRADLAELNSELLRLRRDEKQLLAAAAGARNPSVLTATFNSGY